MNVLLFASPSDCALVKCLSAQRFSALMDFMYSHGSLH